MSDKTIPERLDDLVLWTGIPQLSQQPPRRRPLRWPATIALLLAVGGFATMATSNFSGHAYGASEAAMMIGFAIAAFVQIWGPLKPFGAFNEHADEWDRTVRARSYLVTFAAFAVVTMLGIGVLLQLVVLYPLAPTAIERGLDGLLFTLLTIGTATPTAYASWRWQWRDAD